MEPDNSDLGPLPPPTDESPPIPLSLRDSFATAAFSGALDLIQDLLRENPRLLNATNGRNQTALYCACHSGHLKVANFLLSQPGVDLDARKNGSTALHAACWKGRTAIVKKLLDSGANPIIFNDFGELPHHNASTESVRKVLAAYMSPTAPHVLKLHAYLAKRVEIGDANAAYKLGLIYEEGLGSIVALRTVHFLCFSSISSHTMLRILDILTCSYGDLVSMDSSKASEMFEKAAELGHAESLFITACRAYEKKDYAKALKHFTKASDQGNIDARYNLGLMHQRGDGLPGRDFEKGASFLKNCLRNPLETSSSNPVAAALLAQKKEGKDKRESKKDKRSRRRKPSDEDGKSLSRSKSKSPKHSPRSSRGRSKSPARQKRKIQKSESLFFDPEEIRSLTTQSRTCKLSISANELVENYPPVLKHDCKKLLHAISCPPDRKHLGVLTYTRWKEFNLPPTIPSAPPGNTTVYSMRSGVFGYEEPQETTPKTIEWYINFADHDVFRFYGGQLFAADEIQVGEHPSLASLREYLLAKGEYDSTISTKTMAFENDDPIAGVEVATPILVYGAERRVNVALDKNAQEGRPNGLYGNEFNKADEDAIRKAVKLIDRPTFTNFVAMVAPKYGSGVYTLEMLEKILSIAYTGFLACRLEACEQNKPDPTPIVIIKTGHWGTGAFGGNKVIMCILQLVAARMAGIDKLTYYTAGDSEPYFEASDKVDQLLSAKEEKVSTFLRKLFKLSYQWGRGNAT